MKYFFEKIINRTRRFFREFYKVPYCVPAWGLAEHLAIFFCVLSGRIVHGKKCLQLYEQIKKKTGKPHVFGFNSGREAILAALRAGNIGDGDKVIMPSYCCETVAQAVVASGATIVFCDIGDDYNPDVEHILTLINPEVKAIIFPHMFGNPGHIDVLENELIKRNIRSEILLIDDAAQSFGARLNGKLVGTFGDAGIISFGPGKTMTATGGGLMITDNEDLAKRIECLLTSLLPVWKKFRKTVYWLVFRRWRRFTLPFYPFLKFCFKDLNGKNETIYSMCNVDAALGLKQLKKLDTMLHIRMERKKTLDTLILSRLSDCIILSADIVHHDATLHVATKYPVMISLDSNNPQNKFKEHLADHGFELQNLYTPIHLIKNYGYKKTDSPLSRTENIWDKLVHIPIEPYFNDMMFQLLCRCVEDFATKERGNSNALS
ncbi:MAG: DegT/DnrJ/EryC1/StrS family aminotransferase [Desulfobacteraceae bacterium]|jgi:dTDP-4-amino-4,6-dideoxygalactose transaminase